jgi:hypothetical protein
VILLSVVPIWTNISRRFFLRFRTSVLLSKHRSSHSVAVIYSSFSRVFPKIRRIRLPIFCRFWRHIYSPFALFRACCVVVESHSSHSFANFAVNHSSFSYVYAKIRQVLTSKIFFPFVLGAVLLLSSTPATVTFVFRTLRSLCVSVLCCCWVPLQPQSHLRLRLRLRQL